MSEQRTVYVVTSGEYSSYQIDGVYDTLEAAQKAAGSPMRYRATDSTSIQEWTLGTVDCSSEEVDARDGRTGVMLRNGVWRTSTLVNRRKVIRLQRSGLKETPHYFHKGEPDIWVEQTGSHVTVYAVDRERGLKVLNDRMAEIIAHEEGIA